MMLLKVEKVSLFFGGVQALGDVDVGVAENEILAVIGPNGAGKTSLLNCLSGFYRPQKGRIFFNGREITRLAPHKIARLGIGRTFQNIELFGRLSVVENLLAGRNMQYRSNVLSQAMYFGPANREEVKHRERVEEIIDFLEIHEIRKQPLGSLSYGLRKRVDLGRALAMEPRLLLLDEPMAGMNLEEKEDIARFILDIFEEWDIPVVLVEHDMGVVMDICDRVVVLDFGQKIGEGTPEEVQANPQVVKAYLGEE